MQQKADFQTIPGEREITFKESLGEAVWVGVLYAVGYSVFFVAASNLFFVRPLPLVSFLASLAWVIFVIAFFVFGWHQAGLRQHLVNVIGGFVRNRFAQFTLDSGDGSILSLGYKLGTARHYLLKLRPEGITSVDWGPGQGNIPGKDNDWHVAIWFDTESVILDGENDGLGVFIVGPSGHKATREAFGAGFIEFLKANHVQLTLPPPELLGRVAEVTAPLHPNGRVKIGSDEYAAQPLKKRLERGCKVIVEEIRGTSVFVNLASGLSQTS